MPDYFTEDDVTAAYAVYDSPEVECPHADPSWYVAECDHCRTARVLAAVAPAILARALRQAADRVDAAIAKTPHPTLDSGAYEYWRGYRAAAVETRDALRARAEQVSE